MKTKKRLTELTADGVLVLGGIITSSVTGTHRLGTVTDAGGLSASDDFLINVVSAGQSITGTASPLTGGIKARVGHDDFVRAGRQTGQHVAAGVVGQGAHSELRHDDPGPFEEIAGGAVVLSLALTAMKDANPQDLIETKVANSSATVADLEKAGGWDRFVLLNHGKDGEAVAVEGENMSGGKLHMISPKPSAITY